jgi:hypothetical protein
MAMLKLNLQFNPLDRYFTLKFVMLNIQQERWSYERPDQANCEDNG